MTRTSEQLYDPQFVAGLFNEMSETYGTVNYLSSFGFTERWRRACVDGGKLSPGMRVYDLMTGMGECWGFISDALEGRGELVAVDISPEMCRRARERQSAFDGLPIEVIEGDVLENSLPDGSADAVLSAFGLKTFSKAQQRSLAFEVARLLRPGGTFSLLDVSVPRTPIMRIPYMAYLKYAIPLLGRAFLGNPDNYRLLGVYTQRFGDCTTLAEYLREAGLQVSAVSHFFGCASSLRGVKTS
jgi:ubiquinone/menaquinone biosynthesis C-methylase UbiE